MLTIIFVEFVLAFAVCISTFIFLLTRKNPKYENFPPGPLSIPFIGTISTFGQEPYKTLTKLKNKYGKIIAVDFGSYRGIVLNDFDVIKKAFSLPEFQGRPKFGFTNYIRGENPTGVIWSTGKTNDEQRAVIVKTFKKFGLGKQTMEVLFQDELSRLFETFDNLTEKVIVNFELFNTLAVGALWSIIAGDVNREDETFKAILSTTKTMAASCTNTVMFFPTLSKMFSRVSGWNSLINSVKEQDVFVSKTMETHKEYLKINDEPRDIIDALLMKMKSTHDVNSTFYGENGDRNVLATVGDLLQAGTETVSTCLTWLLAILIRRPDIQDKIYAEIDRVIGQNRSPTLADRQMLPYIEAVIFETLRYGAIVPMGLVHDTLGDVEIEGYTIPKNTIVAVNIHDILFDPNHWDEPEIFKPERFISEDGSEVLRNISNKVELIFGYGKRICPGEAFAKDEMFLFITGLCQRYIFKKDPETHYEDEIEVNLSVTVVPKPHKLIIYKR